MPKHLKTYKDKEKARITRNRQRKKNYGKTSFKYKRRRWTPFEDKLVLNHTITDFELSNQIERSVASIQIRRNRLKQRSTNAR